MLLVRVVALWCVSVSLVTAESREGGRANILFISIDDLRPQMGACGVDYMLTLHLDKLAEEGRVFSKHYAQVPTCGPSRACLLTGLNPRKRSDINHKHLAHVLEGKPEGEQPETFIHHLKRHGYKTIGLGKISHDAEGRHKSEAGEVADELPHSWSEFLRDPENGRRNTGSPLHCYVEGNRFHEDKLPFEKLDVSDEAYPDGRLALLAADKLVELADSDEPFFMALGFYKPHLPFIAPQKYWDFYERSALPLAPILKRSGGVPSVFSHPSSEFFGQYRGNREKGNADTQLSPEYSRELIHAYCAATSYVDAQVGKVLKKLEDSGLDKETVVIVWSDHGWSLGDHSLWGKHSVFERALRSVLMVKVPEIKQAGVATDGLVATVDVYPTLCDLADIPVPPGLDGKSFRPLLGDPQATVRNGVVSYWRDILSLRTG